MLSVCSPSDFLVCDLYECITVHKAVSHAPPFRTFLRLVISCFIWQHCEAAWCVFRLRNIMHKWCFIEILLLCYKLFLLLIMNWQRNRRGTNKQDIFTVTWTMVVILNVMEDIYAIRSHMTHARL